jgi:hypothetical protein
MVEYALPDQQCVPAACGARACAAAGHYVMEDLHAGVHDGIAAPAREIDWKIHWAGARFFGGSRS